MAEHNTLTGAALHEPKGADSASANRVYVADGAGSGAWSQIGPLSITGINNLNQIILADMKEVPSGSYTRFYFIAPVAGTVSKIYTQSTQAVSIAGKIYNAANPSGINMLDAGGSIAGHSVSHGVLSYYTPTGNNTFVAGDIISFEGSDFAADGLIFVTMVLDVS
jgi:hypothetical protein